MFVVQTKWTFNHEGRGHRSLIGVSRGIGRLQLPKHQINNTNITYDWENFKFQRISRGSELPEKRKQMSISHDKQGPRFESCWVLHFLRQFTSPTDPLKLHKMSPIWLQLAVVIHVSSRVAQRKRAGPITQRSMDRNHPLLSFFLLFSLFSCSSLLFVFTSEQICCLCHLKDSFLFLPLFFCFFSFLLADHV